MRGVNATLLPDLIKATVWIVGARGRRQQNRGALVMLTDIGLTLPLLLGI